MNLLAETTDIFAVQTAESQWGDGIYEAHITLLKFLSQEQLDNLDTTLREKGIERVESTRQIGTGEGNLDVNSIPAICIKYKKGTVSLFGSLPRYIVDNCIGIAVFKE